MAERLKMARSLQGESPKPYMLGEDPIRDALRSELVERVKRNSNYSLRAFAKNLNIEPSLLSKLISGKRRVTAQMAERITPHLRLSQAALENIGRRKNTQKFKELSIDEFSVLSEWYHLPLLELILTKDFKDDPKWISKRFGISALEAEEALRRLERLNFVSRTPKGDLVLTRRQNTTLNQGETSAALRSMQRQLLSKAVEALDQIQAKDRDQTGISMAIDRNLIPEAREEIKKFRRRFCKKYQSRRPYNEVYQLLISFFPLSRS